MTDPSKLWRLSPKTKRTAIVTIAVAAVGLLVFVQIIRPDQDAKSYTSRLSSSSKPLEACFHDLSRTTGLDIYDAPDVPLDVKRQNVDAILKQIEVCRGKLADFDKAADELMTFHLAGYTRTYQDAKVSQRQAYDVIGQSNDVMNQYAGLATFLADYYEHINVFRTHTTSISTLPSYLGSAEIKSLQEQEADLRTRAEQLNRLQAPAGFDKARQATYDMFITAAEGYDSLINGLIRGDDDAVSFGYDRIDQAVASYDSDIINQPFEQLTISYIPKQVLQLPGKVENLLATSSE